MTRKGGRQKTATGPQNVAQVLATILADEELLSLALQMANPTPDDHAMILDLLIAKVIRDEPDPAKALNAVARALRARRSITNEAADNLAQAFATALDQIGQELGIDV